MKNDSYFSHLIKNKLTQAIDIKAQCNHNCINITLNLQRTKLENAKTGFELGVAHALTKFISRNVDKKMIQIYKWILLRIALFLPTI